MKCYSQTPEQFGAVVRQQRRARGLRQEDVALAAGVGVRFVGDLERGKPTVQLDQALRVAAALGLTVTLEPKETDDGTRA